MTPDPAADDTRACHALLHELLDTGLDISRAIRDHALDPHTSTEALSDLAAAFERIARAVRRTILLDRRLDHDPAPAPHGFAAAQKRALARRQILRKVEDTILSERPRDREPLEAELYERLERPELDEEIDHRPVAEIIADLVRDLGVADSLCGRPWKRRTPADIAELCARAARTGSPPPAEPGPVIPLRPAPLPASSPDASRARDGLFASAAYFPTPRRSE